MRVRLAALAARDRAALHPVLVAGVGCRRERRGCAWHWRGKWPSGCRTDIDPGLGTRAWRQARCPPDTGAKPHRRTGHRAGNPASGSAYRGGEALPDRGGGRTAAGYRPARHRPAPARRGWRWAASASRGLAGIGDAHGAGGTPPGRARPGPGRTKRAGGAPAPGRAVGRTRSRLRSRRRGPQRVTGHRRSRRSGGVRPRTEWWKSGSNGWATSARTTSSHRRPTAA